MRLQIYVYCLRDFELRALERQIVTAPHKVDHFEPIPRREDRLGPISSWNDDSVVFHGHTILLKLKFGDELVELG